MARTPTPDSLTQEQWATDFQFEYVRDNRFKRYMGRNESSIIHIKEDLTKKKGDQLTYQLLNKLSGAGRTGNETLEGYEEEQDSDGYPIPVSYLRHGVLRTLEDEQATTIDYLAAARVSLKKWMMEKMRDHIITALMSIDSKAYLTAQIAGNTNYTAVATEANKDSWLAANSDRVLFGAAKSNNAANDHSAALLTVDSSTDILSTAVAGVAKRMAQSATPAITPVTVNDEEELFVMFCAQWPFRDLKADTTLSAANRDARIRSVKDNPIFTGGDEYYNNILYREVPEIPVISGVGTASIDVAPNFLCGTQAVGVAFAKMATPILNDTDYKFRKGVGIMEMRGIKKLLYVDPDNKSNEVQHGVVTVYTAAVADT